ncbi:hypothetical protein Pmani_031302 [Petrolisthes manimaculis]|uniref:Uncharacterized protein n=1 Tax=Petrolisthes manimaculis TaxID=1843537 RepID=A0AAE1NVG7_9EUCA|nr:hypothetical protein Pmani_031302 [Petrolisthes manimaculis]
MITTEETMKGTVLEAMKGDDDSTDHHVEELKPVMVEMMEVVMKSEGACDVSYDLPIILAIYFLKYISIEVDPCHSLPGIPLVQEIYKLEVEVQHASLGHRGVETKKNEGRC